MKILRNILIIIFFFGSGIVLLPLAFDSAKFFIYQHANEAFTRVHLRFVPDTEFNNKLKIALDEDEIDLANIIQEIGNEHKVRFEPELIERLDQANGIWATITRNTRKIKEGAATGEITSGYALTGSVASDLLGISDFHELSKELGAYPDYNSFNLGLSLIGVIGSGLTIASIATKPTAVAGVPMRIGATAIKGAKKAGKLSKKLEKFVSGNLDNVINKSSLDELAEVIKKTNVDSLNKTQLDELAAVAKKTVNVKALEPLLDGMTDLKTIFANSDTLGLAKTLQYADDFNDTARLSKISKATKAKYPGYITMAPQMAKSTFKVTRILVEAISTLISALLWLLGMLWYAIKMLRFVFRRPKVAA
jgi:hypothetical protein